MAFARPWEDKIESFKNDITPECSQLQPEIFNGFLNSQPYMSVQTFEYNPHYIPHSQWFHQSIEPYRVNNSVEVKPCDLSPSSSDYSSEDTTPPSSSRRYSPYESRNKHNRLLNKESVNLMTCWYQNNIDNPYLTQQEAIHLSTKCQLTVEQVKKWMANKRMRNRNTKQHKRTKRKVKTV